MTSLALWSNWKCREIEGEDQVEGVEEQILWVGWVQETKDLVQVA